MYDVSVGGSRNTSSTHCTDLHVTHIDASSRSRSEKRWKEGYREAAISNPTLPQNEHTQSNSATEAANQIPSVKGG